MTMLIKIENDKPVDHPILEENFRSLFPLYKYPDILTVENLKPLGYGIYDFSQMPASEKHKKAIETTPIQNEYGIWIQQWELIDMNEDEKKEQDNNMMEHIRSQRNFKLRVSDWRTLSDVEKPSNYQEWLKYRQELRDLTKQEGFPWEINWPEEPK